MTLHRTLIVFAKLPRPGDVKTRLGKSIGMVEACRIYDVFAHHAFAVADDLAARGVSVALHYATGAGREDIVRWVGRDYTFAPQCGATLGERMQHAFRLAFDAGAAQAVIIGTDVPELDAATVLTSFDLLATHDLSIGPSTDGGYYLLGMQSPGYDVFSGVPWSTEAVYAETLRLCERSNLRCAHLPEFTDIDTLEQYEAYRRRSGRG
jgi:uncharacterized protein